MLGRPGAAMRTDATKIMGAQMRGFVARTQPRLKHSNWDALLVCGLLLHAALLALFPSAASIGVALWWNANTIAHNFIHSPFFTRSSHNAVFSALLTLTLGFPQRLWREWHLAHHADRPWRLRRSPQLGGETLLVAALWTTMAVVEPKFFLTTYIPGWLLGMLLCHLQGYFEHVRGTVSHYGRVYNALFFNDGFHAEHHARPSIHWMRLPTAFPRRAGEASRWPAALRWMEWLSLEGLERAVLWFPKIQRWLVRKHQIAFAKVLRGNAPSSALIVGGGLFPRTALVLQALAPAASVTLMDANMRHLEIAARWLATDAICLHGRFDGDCKISADLLVGPLAFCGKRDALYNYTPARRRLVHDWIWRPRGRTAVVSWLLLKRVNLVDGS